MPAINKEQFQLVQRLNCPFLQTFAQTDKEFCIVLLRGFLNPQPDEWVFDRWLKSAIQEYQFIYKLLTTQGEEPFLKAFPAKCGADFFRQRGCKRLDGAFAFFGDTPVPQRIIFESPRCNEQKSFEPKTGHKSPEKFRLVEQTWPVSNHVQRD